MVAFDWDINGFLQCSMSYLAQRPEIWMRDGFLWCLDRRLRFEKHFNNFSQIMLQKLIVQCCAELRVVTSNAKSTANWRLSEWQFRARNLLKILLLCTPSCEWSREAAPPFMEPDLWPQAESVMALMWTEQCRKVIQIGLRDAEANVEIIRKSWMDIQRTH